MLKESVNEYGSDDSLLRDLLLDELTFSKEDAAKPASSDDDDLDETAPTKDESFGAFMTRSIEEIGWIISNCDETATTSTAQDEFDRLMMLKNYSTIDFTHDSILQRMTTLAASILHYEFCWILLMDLRVSWIISSHGIGKLTKAPRHLHIPCAHALNAHHPVMVIENLEQDCRFRDSHYVQGPLACRFYAAAPLVSTEGYRLGVFGVADRKPGSMSDEHQKILSEFAELAMQHLVERRKKVDLETRLKKAVACTSHDIMTPLMGLQLSLGSLKDDPTLMTSLTDGQRDLLSTADSCVTTMCELGMTAMQSIHDGLEASADTSRVEVLPHDRTTCALGDLVDRLHQTMDPIEKKVPLVIIVDKNAQADMEFNGRIFHAALALLCLACARTQSGFIELRVYRESGHLVFNCESTMPALTDDQIGSFANAQLSETTKDTTIPCLRLAAKVIRSLGGSCGHRSNPTMNDYPRSILWFRAPCSTRQSFEECKSEFGPTFDRTHQTPQETLDVGAMAGFPLRSPLKRPMPPVPDGMGENCREGTTLNRARKVLVVDDSLVVRKTLQRAITTQFGYEVTLAEDGREGLARLQETVFDFVLMDFLMPVMDGWDCTHQYRQWEAHHRPWFRQHIIGMSAHAGDNDVQRANRFGMDDYKRKPVTIQTLKDLTGNLKIRQIQTQLDCLLPLFNAPVTATMDLQFNLRKGGILCLSSGLTPRPVKASNSLLAEVNKRVHDGRSGRRPVCLVCRSSSAESAWNTVSTIEEFHRNGWGIELVQKSDEALARLKQRNYDAVIIENEPLPHPGRSCIQQFREWESTHRVHRQKNVLWQLAHAGMLSQALADGASALIQPPVGFDGVIGAVAGWKDFASCLVEAAGPTNCSAPAACIVLR